MYVVSVYVRRLCDHVFVLRACGVHSALVFFVVGLACLLLSVLFAFLEMCVVIVVCVHLLIWCVGRGFLFTFVLVHGYVILLLVLVDTADGVGAHGSRLCKSVWCVVARAVDVCCFPDTRC